MSPADLSSDILRIASAIEESKNPSRKLVARDLQALISRISADKKLNPYFFDPSSGHINRIKQQAESLLKGDISEKRMEEVAKDIAKMAEALLENIEKNWDVLPGLGLKSE